MTSPVEVPVLSVRDEVRANQEILRSRLTGAISEPPPGVLEEDLPSVPLIDLGSSFSSDPCVRKAVASQIREACTTSGFFQISNHGVPDSAIADILAQAHAFFHKLTPSQKDELHIRHSKLFRGYEAGGDTYVNPDDNVGADIPEVETKEGFNGGYEPSLDPDSTTSGSFVELDGHPPAGPDRCNVWPESSLLPHFRPAVEAYYAEVLSLARHLFRLFALSLNLEENYFDKLTTHPGGVYRLLHYPPQSPEQMFGKEKTLGLGAHTDYECFTLLLSTAHPGLEILFPPSTLTGNKPVWRPCPIRPGTLTVNVADFLMRWTNGLYKSTIHRVVSRPVREVVDGHVVLKGSDARYSVPFFFSINYDADVEPLPEEAVGISKFQKMKAGEYVLERLRATV
ncbi:hypothetical protein BKA67DRAFT_581259 [Truncatella angustata]|uniref:Fe2OG dioxygenase domain-containing protein n=1 Tax=Truncatella angustata TaxID=152316 RepID=A0A9P8RJ59_9PEZI|nr:uncharacterized protein BKA67DRAFT_581259 [Truncatella angustata]KAH6647004.1 hypothetical protein BKA67DRAFT_581259 [Truncatella angustata]